MENLFDKIHKYLAYRTDLKHPSRLISLFCNILIFFMGIKDILMGVYLLGILNIFIFCLLMIIEILFYVLTLKRKKEYEELEQLIKKLEEKLKEK